MKSRGKLLEDYLASLSLEAKPFDWGLHNCAHFCNLWRVYTGQEGEIVFPPLRTQKDVLRFLEAYDGDLAAAVDALAPLERIPCSFVQLGDIVLCRADNFQGLGIFIGPAVALLGMDGKPVIAYEQPLAAWRLLHSSAYPAEGSSDPSH